MEELREQLIEDIVTYLDKLRIKNNDLYPANIQNTIMQIIVDSFDEYERKKNQ